MSKKPTDKQFKGFRSILVHNDRTFGRELDIDITKASYKELEKAKLDLIEVIIVTFNNIESFKEAILKNKNFELKK